MTRSLFAIAALLVSSLSANAGPLDLAKEGMLDCIANAPDLRPVKDKLKRDGWDHYGNESGAHFYLSKRKDAVFGITLAYERPACAFGIKNMSTEKSLAYGEAFAAELFGKSKAPLPESALESGMVAGWHGTTSGKDAAVFVYGYSVFDTRFSSALIMIGFK